MPGAAAAPASKWDEDEHVAAQFARAAAAAAAAARRAADAGTAAHGAAEEAALRTVDISAFAGGGGGAASRAAAVRDAVAACEELGFFCVRGHGVDWALVDACVAAFTEMHHRPEAEKRGLMLPSSTARGWSQYPSGGEGFCVGPPDGEALYGANAWPAASRLRELCAAYYAEMERVEGALLAIFSAALGCAADGELRARCGRHRGLLRFNYRAPTLPPPPPGAPPPTLRQQAHTDWSTVSILTQVGPALEVIQGGAWRKVTPRRGAFIVNIGDMMHRFSNGRFQSTIHCTNPRLDVERSSLVYFGCQALDGADDTPIEPYVSSGAPPLFPPISIKGFMAAHYAAHHKMSATAHGGTASTSPKL